MCEQLCEQTEDGRAIWERWRTRRDNWQEAMAFHRELVLSALRAAAASGAPCVVITCPGEEELQAH
jgi:hypothetical protein